MQLYANRSFGSPVSVIEAFDAEGLADAFSRIEQAWKTSVLLGYIRYEARNALRNPSFRSELPLLYFEVHDTVRPYVPSPRPEVPLTVVPSVDFATYRAALQRIKKEIADGNTYQVNYTYDCRVRTPLGLIKDVRQVVDNYRDTTPISTFGSLILGGL